MAEHEHLRLRRLEGELQRRKPPGFGGGPKRTPGEHGPKIESEVASVLEAQSNLPPVEGVDPSLILRIELSGLIDENAWAALGLVVLSEDTDKTLLLFATDKELTEFRARIQAYQGDIPPNQKNPRYAGLIEAIQAVGVAGPSDRIGQSLSFLGLQQPADFDDHATYILDVELFHPGDKSNCDIFAFRLEQCLKAYGGTILNTYTGDRLLLCRVEANGSAIKAALLLPEVASVEAPPRPDLQTSDIGSFSLDDISPGSPPSNDAIAIGVIDSGVNFGHPLLTYAERGAFAQDANWSPADDAGHGTSVASMAAYGSVEARAESGNFDDPFFLVSAKVVDGDSQFPKDVTVPEVMEVAVRRLHGEFGCRIFNVSLADPHLIYSDGKAGIWASTLDALARELDILFVVSTGNQSDLLRKYGEDILNQYPGYLLDSSSRLLDPATAANVLSIGSIAHSNGLEEGDEELAGVRPICEADAPSPFTRSGPGIRGMIKPDLVDYGGNAVWDGPVQALVSGGKKSSAGVWAFHDEPITKQLFRSRSGTSFSTPIIANKAASLLASYPAAPANFLRAMLALSGETTSQSSELFAPPPNQDLLMVCGNGIPNLDHALSSDDSRVVFHTDDQLDLDCFAVYELPIPDLFQTTNGLREIKVSLAFDAPVRRTRADYLGVTMGWRLLRGANEKDVFDKFRIWEEAEGEPPEFPDKNNCKTFPGSQLREKGTLQCASFTARTNISNYGSKYYIAVWCRRRWAPEDIKMQRFSLAVQLRHEADIGLYQSLTIPAKLKA